MKRLTRLTLIFATLSFTFGGHEAGYLGESYDNQEVANSGRVLPENDPTWKAGGTTLQGYSSQHFTTADPIKVDSSKKVELLLRLVAREDETDLVFPEDECKPLSTLCPPAVPE